MPQSVTMTAKTKNNPYNATKTYRAISNALIHDKYFSNALIRPISKRNRFISYPFLMLQR